MGLTPLQFDLKYCYNGLCEGLKWFIIRVILVFTVKQPTVISIPPEFLRVIASSWHNLENIADSLHFKAALKHDGKMLHTTSPFSKIATAAF